MSEFILTHETALRLGIFAAALLLLIVAEAIFPRKARSQPRPRRWLANLSLVIIDTVTLRLALPVLAAGAAIYAQSRGWGLFYQTALPAWLEVTLAMILLDLALYWQHVATHKIPILWRLHKVHHTDRDIDVTTGSRFHPLEILLSMIYKIALVMMLGAPVLAVILFEIILNGCAMFNHANLRLPKVIDHVLRKFIVTPDMHRVHHSVRPEETHSNFGFSISLWDHLFGTYRAQPKAGHEAMVIGLPEYQSREPSSLLWSLLLPFKAIKKPADPP